MQELRLIDANTVKSRIGELFINNDYFSAEIYVRVIEVIDAVPTIEAELVRYGRWINDTFCSECKRFPVDVSVSISNKELTKHFTRCPHCGAKMEGVSTNEINRTC